MPSPLYGQHRDHSSAAASLYSAARSSAAATDAYLPEPVSLSSRYLPSFSEQLSLSSDPSSFSHYPSLSSSSSLRAPADSLSSDLAASRSYAAGAALPSSWSALDSSPYLSKRSSQAIYDQSVLSAHMIGQSEAWLASDYLTKRPRMESASNLPIYPQRPGEKDCAHYLLTRTCKFGDNCKFDHPIWVPAGGIPDWKEPPGKPDDPHPERPGEPDCPFFLKTQTCKFGLKCKFNHPKDKLGSSGKTDTAFEYPERPSEPLCSFYAKTGLCKFGQACKFHHPKDIQIPSAGQETEGHTDSVENGGTIAGVNAVKDLMPSPALSYNSKGFPIRVGETDCTFYMKTGSCKYGANCRYNHPDRSVINTLAAAVGHSGLTSPLASLNVGLVNPAVSILQSLHPGLSQTMGLAIYPQRPEETECDYYMKTGECKFGERCRFHHPINRTGHVKLSLAGLPRREGATPCSFYMKTGTCSYGVTCRFDHPPPGEVLASAAGKDPKASGSDSEEER